MLLLPLELLCVSLAAALVGAGAFVLRRALVRTADAPPELLLVVFILVFLNAAAVLWALALPEGTRPAPPHSHPLAFWAWIGAWLVSVPLILGALAGTLAACASLGTAAWLRLMRPFYRGQVLRPYFTNLIFPAALGARLFACAYPAGVNESTEGRAEQDDH